LRRKKTIIHVTHEAREKRGGIGTVLEGMLTSGTYQKETERSIIVGPLLPDAIQDPQRLGPQGQILFSSMDGKTKHPFGLALSEVERKYGVSIVYGIRRFSDPSGKNTCEAETLLLDVRQANIYPVNAFKAWLFEEFGIESIRYENDWEYEQYVKLAPAALAALRAIGASKPEHPGIIFAHEYMGMPTALAAVMDPLCAFKTVFYAHEVHTIRRIIESHPGHDTMFYNAHRWAKEHHFYLPEIFGSQADHFRHVLIDAARHCDNIIAVSDGIRQELLFLDPRFNACPIDVCYNGIPAWEITLDEKQEKKQTLQRYAVSLLGYAPDYIFTHVSRLCLSKAIWRDLRVLEHLEQIFQVQKKTGIFFILSSDLPRRGQEQVQHMEQGWHWPIAHREKGADLTDTEAEFYTAVQIFNTRSRNIKVIFLNQFGWDRVSCGDRMPETMQFMDLRIGSDVEMGQSIYEPFGISQLESLSFGGICVLSGVCGCLGFIRATSGPAIPENLIVADYTQLPDLPKDLASILQIYRSQRDQIEYNVSESVAKEIFQRLTVSDEQKRQRIEKGFDLAHKMTWDAVCENYLLKAVDRAYSKRRQRQIA